MEVSPGSPLLSQAAQALGSSVRELPATAKSELRRWAEGFTRAVQIADENRGIANGHPAEAPDGARPNASPVAALVASTLEAALSITGTSRGNVQLVDGTGTLTIVAHAGFDSEFLEYFAVVDDDSAACGRAARSHAPVVIHDVTRDPRFAPHRDIAAASKFRAVQSTPLAGPTGVTLGVVSTHFRQPHTPSPKQARAMASLAQLAGAALAAHLTGWTWTEPDIPAGGQVAAFTQQAQTWLRSLGSTFVGVDQVAQHPTAAQVLAHVIAAYLVAADESAKLRNKATALERALLSRVVIEQAKGVIAATSGIGIDDAFHVLRRYARNHNATIHAVAHDVVSRGLRP